ncbi:MAG: S41 family peptidase [Planctomycetaceae bacterium]
MTLPLNTKFPSAQNWKVVGVLLANLLLCAAFGMAQNSDWRPVADNHDFGPSPETYQSSFSNRVDLRGEDNSTLSGAENRRARGRDPAAPARLHSLDDLLDPVERPPAPSPAGPSALPARPHTDEPTLEQKILLRYQDPRVVRILSTITPLSGEAFFHEVSQMIDERHIEPSSYAQRVSLAFDHLRTAVAMPTFQQAAQIRPSAEQVQKFQYELQGMKDRQQVRNRRDAIAVIRQVGTLGQTSLGLKPGAVYLAFVLASLDTLDRFSMLLPPERTGEVSLGLKESLVGIGVEVESHPDGLLILKAFPGGPAAEATLKKGDLITAVDGRSLAGMEILPATDLITGQAGTTVKLNLRRGALIAEIGLVRRSVELSSISEVRMLEDDQHVGYIKLDQFAENSAKELDQALWKLHGEGMESLVLDLRGNPGGYLTTAIEISDRFLPAGTIVSTRGRNTDDNSQETATFANTWKMPLVVLIDRNSASASEILAAAIQENGRGLIVGETSYGKGTVQTLFPLHSINGGLRLTTAKFYSPDGRAMAGAGVTPDVNVNAPSDDVAMMQAALQVTRDPRLQSMAEQFARTGRTGMRVIRVAA